MSAGKIKNVIFDIGNVMVRWAPLEIIRLTFSVEQPEALRERVFRSQSWIDLNIGKLTEAEVKVRLQQEFGFSADCVEQLFYYVRQTQLLIYRSVELLTRVKVAGYHVYALTDNVKEVVAYLQSRYDFWPLFEGAVVSAEVGCMKPDPIIYHHLLNQYHLSSEESVFIDDMPRNVAGAQAIGMSAIQFVNVTQCEQALFKLGLSF